MDVEGGDENQSVVGQASPVGEDSVGEFGNSETLMGLASEGGGGAVGDALPVKEGVGLEDETAEVEEGMKGLGCVVVEGGWGVVGKGFGVHCFDALERAYSSRRWDNIHCCG